MKKWNKLLALLLAMVMALGTTVTAYADGEEATEPAEDTNTAENVETTEEPAEDAAPAEGEDAAAPAEDETPAEDAAPVEGEDAAAAEAGYTDVTEANWFYEAVTYVTENGLMAGETETTFAPTAAVTGADLTDALEAVASAGAVADGESVTRETLAVLLWTRAGEPEAQADLSAFADAADISADSEAAVTWAVAQGLLQGNADGTLDLDGAVTRAQAATVVMRLAQAA